MEAQTVLALSVVALLLFKHLVFDFVLQTRYQLDHKHVYGHPGGLTHAGLHLLGSVPAVLIARPAPATAILVLIAEFAFHYHVDWTKEQILRRGAWGASDGRHWAVFGADQFLHGLSYLVMAAVLVSR